VSDWAVVFLGVIAVASLATSIAQLALLVSTARMAKRAERLMDTVEQEIRPILGHLNTIGRDASHAASLAAVQVERVDHVFGMLVQRLEETVDTIQSAVLKPAREATALAVGIRTALNFIKELRTARARSRADDEDALFI
jgi:uncharacterized protein YoxC